MMFAKSTRRARSGAAIAGALLASGCASLPASGPTAHEILRSTEADRNAIGMRVVDVDSGVLAQVSAMDAGAQAGLTRLAALARAGRNDVVGPGDQLDITVFEVGASLFGTARGSTEGYDASAQAQRFPAVVVDANGAIRLPYIGLLPVAGRTPSEIATRIEGGYRGKSQNPQVVVTVRGNLSDTVYVTGDVRRPGRIELSLQSERLLDAIGTAGGTVAQTQDMVVRVTRDGRQVEQRLDRVRAASPDDLVLVPGDRIELIRQPQTYVVLGAANRPSQVSFDQSNLTLAEAVARAGGPNDAAANPRAVFLFRYDPTSAPSTASAATPDASQRPTIYRLNLLEPSSYFLAQRFAMRDKDVLYISNAGINRTAKFVSIINQLFSPFVAVRTVTGH
ncbi:polysaccharide biosynthesis/export family protein [Sphingomonas sp. CROZ-RG-20F-R02-07]|uniref:polysaccharide biosynthesis/export family protein n=1 Tax=Sphingomonas sp. CROZ-RG-20F-R02-07 TaxID=2914832 RepID=UPI001F568DA8|nr:polysaccharide biosynthesis/export family protein [Sphingomonas sp. CROZ-RG-20F-R02-07]